jgi:hypothetical protein
MMMIFGMVFSFAGQRFRIASAFALAIFSGKIIFIIANQENLRIFLICFFTGGAAAANSICHTVPLISHAASRPDSFPRGGSFSSSILSFLPDFCDPVAKIKFLSAPATFQAKKSMLYCFSPLNFLPRRLIL